MEIYICWGLLQDYTRSYFQASEANRRNEINHPYTEKNVSANRRSGSCVEVTTERSSPFVLQEDDIRCNLGKILSAPLNGTPR